MPLTDNELELLTPEECRALLARGSMGRVAVTVAALPAIFPVSYSILGDAIIFLTGEGTKLRAAAQRAVVAFQVDEFDLDAHTGWSVLAVGIATEIAHGDELAVVEALGLEPMAGGDRNHFVKIQPELVSGRRLFRTS
jgi:nitroimidazol reductase NimA-like FMN-containing flavoprotein (pyridoxamine 5'-phosphate oxidase superfamily)